MIQRRISHSGARGAVSIFIVVFSAILITTVVVSFIRIMIQQQGQATNNDLSRSALDSAQSGVEDAKRALVWYRDFCLKPDTNNMSDPRCVQLHGALSNTGSCKAIQDSGIPVAGQPTDDEVLIRQTQSNNDEALQQAYTCVKIKLNTDDYIGSLGASGSRVIPLKALDGEFDKVTIEWFSQSDLSGNNTISLTTGSDLPPLGDTDWPANRPALLRAQVIQYGDTYNLDDFNRHNAHTLFLKPSQAGLLDYEFADDARGSSSKTALKEVRCEQPTINRQYACSVTLSLPPVEGAVNAKRTGYLRLSSLYNDKTTFRVKLSKMVNGAPADVQFNGVQPIVDSTGRANSLFRRVQSRVEIDNSTFPFPEAAVDIASGLCKSFTVTDTQYIPIDALCTDN